MKEELSGRLTDGEPLVSSSVVQEIAVMAGIGEVINVRAAKAHLSALLDEVARGREVVITSGGKPKARLVPPQRMGKPFTFTDEDRQRMPPWQGGMTADEIIREDRESRD